MVCVGERALAIVPVESEDTVNRERICPSSDCPRSKWIPERWAWQCKRVQTFTAQWAGSDQCVDAVLEETLPWTPLQRYEWSPNDSVSLGELVTTLDYLRFEAVYVVSLDGVSVYHPVWFGLESDDEPTVGALVAVETLRERRTLREMVRTLKDALLEGIDAGLLTVLGARDCLVRFIYETFSSRIACSNVSF